MLRRMQAQKRGDEKRIERIEKVLQSLHHAIDKVTGFAASPINGDGQICRARVGKSAGASIAIPYRSIVPNQ